MENMERKKINKKGIIDIATILVVLFFVGIALILIYGMFQDIEQTLRNDTSIDNSSLTYLSDFNTRYVSVYDSAFLILLIGMLLISLILSSYLNNSPVWIVLGILFLIVILTASALMNNAFGELSQDPTFMSANFPIMNWVFNNLFVVMIIFAGFNLIAIYGKKYVTGG